MRIKLIGFSMFTSKKGNQCCVIGYAWADDRWTGLRVNTSFVDPSLAGCGLVPGHEYDLSFDMSGRIVALSPAK